MSERKTLSSSRKGTTRDPDQADRTGPPRTPEWQKGSGIDDPADTPDRPRDRDRKDENRKDEKGTTRDPDQVDRS